MRNFITCVFCTQTSTVSLFSNLLKKVTELITHASTKAYYRQQHLWRKSTFEMPPGEVRHEISRVIRACVKKVHFPNVQNHKNHRFNFGAKIQDFDYVKIGHLNFHAKIL